MFASIHEDVQWNNLWESTVLFLPLSGLEICPNSPHVLTQVSPAWVQSPAVLGTDSGPLWKLKPHFWKLNQINGQSKKECSAHFSKESIRMSCLEILTWNKSLPLFLSLLCHSAPGYLLNSFFWEIYHSLVHQANKLSFKNYLVF